MVGNVTKGITPVQKNFADRVLQDIAQKKSPTVIAIDPVYARLPAEISEHRDLNDEADVEAALDASLEFCRRVIRIVAPHVCAIKLNSAFFERYYNEGIEGYFELVQEAAEHGLIVIGDIKRGDIGHSSEMYARAHLGDSEFTNLDDLVTPDAVTVSGYFGTDGVKPFIDAARDSERGKGVFVLVRTSNESAGTIQDVPLADGRKFHELMAAQVDEWAAESGLTGARGYSSVGAVVSTRDQAVASRLRSLMPQSLLLAPGYGAQGMTAADFAPLFKSDGSGALVVAGRSVIYAYEDPRYIERFTSEWDKCIEQACKDFVNEIRQIARLS